MVTDSALSGLIACAGVFRGTNTLQDPHTQSPQESAATAVVTPVLGGRFVRIDYTWAYAGTPQEGSLLVGHDEEANALSAHWIDSWHMGSKAMACQGAVDASGVISVRGAYAAPPGPDWGWRTVITPGGGRTLRLVMFNIWPEGREELAVEAFLTRE